MKVPRALVGLLCFILFSCVADSDNFSNIGNMFPGNVFPKPSPAAQENVIESQEEVVRKCFRSPPCDRRAKYRSLDGSCNNLLRPTWGMAKTSLLRVLPARYSDAQGTPPKSKSGNELPNARLLANIMYGLESHPDKVNTLVLMQWGQFVAHDTTAIRAQSIQGQCCNGESLPPSLPVGCFPIPVAEDDPFYKQFDKTCIPLTRSQSTGNISCHHLPPQQIIATTHFVDASLVYGSDEETARGLRQQQGGLLTVQEANNQTYLPNTDNGPCTMSDVCYRAGDGRVNQNPGITILQILMLREHNRVAKHLGEMNPHWDDETIYQETRRIIIAQNQHITYAEWLPVILGETPREQGYNPSLNPSTLNLFAAGCYRYFHTLVEGHLKLINAKHETSEEVRLSDSFNNPQIIQKGDNFDNYLRGTSEQPMQMADSYFTPELRNFLFKGSRPFGNDLEAIDIQRGRDHGVPAYNTVRQYCGLKRAKQFSDFSDTINKEEIDKLSSNYEHVDDVDLIVGGTLEGRHRSGMVGPTCKCIVKEQFERWRNGDRFYYRFLGFPGSFTRQQLQELKKASLAGLFCANGITVTEIQKKAFFQVSDENPVVPCSEIPMVSLEPWRTK